jgi:hypothetical protein
VPAYFVAGSDGTRGRVAAGHGLRLLRFRRRIGAGSELPESRQPVGVIRAQEMIQDPVRDGIERGARLRVGEHRDPGLEIGEHGHA